MKPLLLALLLAAPLSAANVEGPSGPKGSAPVGGPSAVVPSLPSAAPGLPGIGAVPSLGASVGGVQAPSAGPSAAAGAPQARLSGPEAAGPQGAPEAGKPSAAAPSSHEEQAGPKAVSEADTDGGVMLPSGAARKDASTRAAAAKPGSEADTDGGVMPPSAETQKAGADRKFDGQAPQKDAAPAVAAPQGFAGTLASRLGLSRFTGAKAERPKTAFDRDNFGGPQKLELTRAGKLKYGLKWGLSLTGIATLIQFALGALFSFFPWQLNVSHSLLQGAGRVELLTGAGPAALGEAIMSHPVAFFLFQLPMMTLKEELVFRALQFGLTFLFLSALRPAAALVSSFVAKVPDVFGWNRAIQKGLKIVSAVSGKAFQIAAVLSAWSFATAHFAAWGIDPITIAVHATLGFALAYVAYKTRSLATAFVAHLSYNVLSLGAVALAIVLSPLVGMAYGLGLSVVSVAGLYLHWRSYRKAKKLAGAQARLSLKGGVTMLLLAAVLGGSFMMGGSRSAMSDDVRQALAQQAAPVQKAPQGQVPPDAKQLMDQLAKQLGTDSAPEKLEGLAAVTAQAKQSVVEIIDPGVGLGSGYIVSADGLVLTNGHVVGTASEVIVKLEDGSQGKAKVVAVNHDKDIAIVQLPQRKDGWPALKIASGDKVHEGDEVLAMGHPLGLPFSVSRGIVSGLGQHRGNLYVDHLQTDAAINHGNSGGPLISAKTGEVVGMNTQIASTVDANIGLGFSISAKDLQAAVDQYRATGNINGSWAGIIINTSVEPEYKQGIEIEQVRPGSPAAKAGLQPGDRVLGAEGQMFNEPQQALHQLALTIARTKPGTEIVLAVGREGEVALVKLKLADKKS